VECGGPAEPGQARMVLWDWYIPMGLCNKCAARLNVESWDGRQWLKKMIEWCDKFIKYAPQYYIRESYKDKKARLEESLREDFGEKV
jgi:hypothetical protein